MSVRSVSEIATESTPVPPGLSRSGKVRAVLALGAVVGIGSVLTLAAWTDTGTAVATFSTGSIDIQLDGDQATPSYAFADLSMSGMQDGSIKYGGLLVNNAGTLDFEYTMATTFTGDAGLAAALRITVASIGLAQTCDQTNFGAGTTISGPVAVGATFAISTPRQLTTATNENLCFKIELPSGSDNSVQGKTVDTSLTFTATQLP